MVRQARYSGFPSLRKIFGLPRTSIFWRSGETGATPAPMKPSLLNVGFKTERFIGAAAAPASSLRQKTAGARQADFRGGGRLMSLEIIFCSAWRKLGQ